MVASRNRAPTVAGRPSSSRALIEAEARRVDDRSRPALRVDAIDESAVVQAVHTAFADFYRASFPRLAGFLRLLGVPLRDATDLAQETMIEAYRSWASIEQPHAWTRRVASRLWARRLACVDERPVAEVPEPPSLLTITDVTAWEQRHDLLQVLDRLPGRQRQVLAWTLDGYSPAEIAAELDMTADAVRASLYKARNAVAVALESGAVDD